MAVVRVLFVNTPTAPPLGADTWIHVQILRHLDRATHELYAACARGRRDRPTPTYQALRAVPDLELMTVDFGPELEGRSWQGKVVALVRTVPALIHLVRLAVLVWRRRIDVIHTSDRPRDALACVLLARLTRRTCIVHVHVRVNPWMSRMLRWSLRHAEHLVAVSEFVAESVVRNGIPPERVHVVLNAINVGDWEPGRGREAARLALGIPRGAPVLLSVSRLFREKGPADAIRALALIRKELPDTRLLIAGAAMPTRRAFEDELRVLARDLGLVDAVQFLGHRPDVEALMAAADVYVMPSFEEPFGLVFVEAMAMGLPIAALDNGGTKEIVEHDHSGLLSPPLDVAGLAANVLALLRNPDRRARMGEYGRRRAIEQFDAGRMVADTARVYESIT